MQSNLVKQLAKLVKVRYVEDITYAERVGKPHPPFSLHALLSDVPALDSKTLLIAFKRSCFWPNFDFYRSLPRPKDLKGVYSPERNNQDIGGRSVVQKGSWCW